MYKIIIGILLFMIPFIAGCGSKTEDGKATQGKEQDISTPNLVYSCIGMDKVVVVKDIVYKTDHNKDLKMDVYYPFDKNDAYRDHTVILVHGSGPLESYKDTAVYSSWGRVIAANGFTVVVFNWRPLMQTGDVEDLIKYVRYNAGSLKINSENISIFAFSAGVKEGVSEALKTDTGFLESIVAYYGEVDPSILTSERNSKLPPMFIAMAANDTIIPSAVNDKFIEEAKKGGAEIVSITHSTGLHGFDVTNNDEETKNIIEKTLKFLKDNTNM